MQSSKVQMSGVSRKGGGGGGGGGEMLKFRVDRGIKTAFDTIDHNILLRKLRICGVDAISIEWFEFYLFRRSQRCSLPGQLSNAAPVCFLWHQLSDKH